MGKNASHFLRTTFVRTSVFPVTVVMSAVSGILFHFDLALADGCPRPSFAEAHTPGIGFHAESLVTADFNGDGKPDLAGVFPVTNGVWVMLGKGDGTFQAAVNYDAGTDPFSVAVGDLDGDGKPDLVVANYNSDNVSVLLGLGDGTFRTAVNYDAGKLPSSVVVADFNGDGKLDLAVANQGLGQNNFIDGSVSVLLGKGDGTFQPAANYGAGIHPYSMAVGDFNGDAKPDLVVVNLGNYQNNYTNGSVSVLICKGDGTFQPALNFDAGKHPLSVAIGDFNSDGKPDLAVADNVDLDSGPVLVLAGNGDGTFQTPTKYGVGRWLSFLSVGDFNGDGKPDLAVIDGGSGTVSVLLHNGFGNFQPPVHYAAGAYPVSLAMADFNGDGHVDLAVANYGITTLLLGRGNGTFERAINNGVGERALSAVAVDFNNDGKADLVVANSESVNVSVLFGKGDGTFLPATNYGVGSNPWSIAAGDFNHDGQTDLAVANFGSRNISVLLGRGDGTFHSAVNYVTRTNPVCVVVSDFNGDGNLDLAVANRGSWQIDFADGGVSVLLGKGDGTFQPAVNYVAGTFPTSLAMGDFNGDGKPDLAVANHLSHNVSVLLGKGDGTFQAAVNYGAGGWPNSIVVGDFNSDGKPDVVVADYYGASEALLPPPNVSVLLGRGDGTFQDAASYISQYSLWSLVVDDFNGDGKPDLAGEMNGVSILLGNGDGTFQFPGNYGSAESTITVGDFNGDGKPDLAGVNGSSGHIFVLLNTCVSAGIHLGVAHNNSNLTLSWPHPSTGFLLESSESFGSTNWQPVAEMPRTNNDRLELTAPFNQPSRFFRLRKP